MSSDRCDKHLEDALTKIKKGLDTKDKPKEEILKKIHDDIDKDIKQFVDCVMGDEKEILVSAEWCGPCKEVEKYMEEEKITSVDIVKEDEQPERVSELAKKHEIIGFPTLITKKGETIVGSDEIIEHLKG